MRLKTQLLPVLAAGLLFAACQADDIPGPDAKELYNRDFIKNFGVFDANHDWNMATQAGVTVSSATPTDVKIYADVNGSRYLFGTFQGVTGNRTLSVDVPKGTDRLIVNANGRNYEVTNGASLTLDARSFSRATENEPTLTPELGELIAENSLFSAHETADFQKFDDSYFREILETLPEGKRNTHKPNIHSNFHIEGKAGETFTFYPIYWNTSSSHALGLYWLNEKGEFEWCDITGNGTENAAIEFNAGERMQDIYFTRSGKLKFYANLWGGGYQEQDSKGQYSMGYQAYPKVKYDDNGKLAEFPDCYVMAKGVTITFKKDQAFGFYIKVKGGTDCLKSKADETGNLPFMPSQANYDHIMFSQEDRNEFFGRVVFRDNTYYTKDEIEWYWDKVDEEGKPTSASNVLYRIKDPANEGNYLYENLTGYGWGEGFEKSFNGQAWRFHDFGDDVKNGFRSGETTYARASLATVSHMVDGVKQGTRTFFAFEDWSKEPVDLNDIIFVVKTGADVYDKDEKIEIPEDPDPDPTPDEPDKKFMWIVAAEDLGITDFDFNDVVFGVTNPVSDKEGNRTVQIYPLAAGGTMPVYLYYNKTLINPEGTADGEFHSWFKGNHDSTKPINVGGYAAEGDPYTLAVDKDFTMACCTEGAYTNMGGFTIKVDKTADYEEHTITPPDHTAGVTAAPQMICLGTQWFWPTEMTHIWDPYPGFLEWCQDRNTAHNWHDHANIPEEHSGRVVRHNFGVGVSGGGDTTVDPASGENIELKLVSSEINGGLIQEYELTDAMKKYFVYNGDDFDLKSITFYIVKESGSFGYYDAGNAKWSRNYSSAGSKLEIEVVNPDMTKDQRDEKLALLNSGNFHIAFWEKTDDLAVKVYIKIEVTRF